MKLKVTQSCLTFCDPMDHTVHGILQARILKWVSLLQGIFSTQGSNPHFPHCRQILYQLSREESPRILRWAAYPCPAHLLNPGIEQESPALQGILYQLSSQGSPSVGLILITDRVMLFNISLLSGLLFVLHMKLALSLKNKSVQMTSPLRTLPSLLKTLAKQF